MLTDRGKSLRQVLIVMSQWGEQQIAQQQAQGEAIILKRSDYNGYLRY
jgi:DNA-binding HxlR family transcriptional regulator